MRLSTLAAIIVCSFFFATTDSYSGESVGASYVSRPVLSILEKRQQNVVIQQWELS